MAKKRMLFDSVLNGGDMKILQFAQLKKKISQLALLLILNISAATKAEILIFVSFSMPNSSLQSYYAAAQNHEGDVRLVMRGLYQDSFAATRFKVEEVAIAYDIDPELFDKYQVVSVPTIVFDDGQITKKVSGHITLKSALEIFAQD